MDWTHQTHNRTNSRVLETQQLTTFSSLTFHPSSYAIQASNSLIA